MKGQWIGNYNGTNQGQIIIELDEQPNNYVGWAYLFDSTPGHPPSSAQVITHSKDVDQENEFLVGPVNVGIASVVSWQNEKEKYQSLERQMKPASLHHLPARQKTNL